MSNDVKKDDGLDIPEALLVKNRKPLTPEQQAEAKKKAVDQAYDPKKWDKPKDMSDEDYDAMKNRDRQKKESDKPKRAKKEAKPKKAEPPKDTFKLTPWARKNKLNEKLVRRVARANEVKNKGDGALEKLAVAKYTYPNSAEAKVAAIIKAGMGELAKPKADKIGKKKKLTPGPQPTDKEADKLVKAKTKMTKAMKKK